MLALLHCGVYALLSTKKSFFTKAVFRLFGHTDWRHDLVTTREVAAVSLGIVQGSKVKFRFKGERLEVYSD